MKPARAVEALIAKGVNKDIALWYKNYLIQRHKHIDIKGASTIRQISIGYPQGGVLSMLLWSIAFDDMVALFNNSRIICVGYADDGSLIMTGKDLKQLYECMNNALGKCQEWATKFVLDISLEKTEYLLCTRQLSTSFKIPDGGLKLKGMEIECSETVKLK